MIDGNYSAARPRVWRRADTVIWFDLPRRTVMRQIVVRTIRRITRKAEGLETSASRLGVS